MRRFKIVLSALLAIWGASIVMLLTEFDRYWPFLLASGVSVVILSALAYFGVTEMVFRRVLRGRAGRK